MTPAEQIRRLNSVAEARDWFRANGNALDSQEHMIFGVRFDALMKLEAHSGQSVTATASRQK